MKKIIQLVSFLGLALIFGGITANAQAVTKVDAKIPFDFVVGDRDEVMNKRLKANLEAF